MYQLPNAIAVWVFFITPVVAFTANAIANFLLISRFPPLGIVKSVLLSTGIGMAAFCGATWWTLCCLPTSMAASDVCGRITNGFLAYLAASYVFFHLVHIPVASVRIRILNELAVGGPLSQDDILLTYNSRDILNMRLGRLERSGQIKQTEGAYVTGRPRLLHVARVFAFIKSLLLG